MNVIILSSTNAYLGAWVTAGFAVGGAVLTGGVGALAGFAGKKTKQTDFVCMDCGQQFQQ